MFTSEVAYMIYTLVIIAIIFIIEKIFNVKSNIIDMPIITGVWVSLLAIIFRKLLNIPAIVSTYIAAATLTLYVLLLAVSFLANKPK